MKRIIVWMLTAILLTAALPLTAAGEEEPGEIFQILFPDVTLTWGENDNLATCTVTCRIAEGESMLNGKFTLTYDPRFLELQVPDGKLKKLSDLPGAAFNIQHAGTVVIAFSQTRGMDEGCCIAKLPFKVLHPRSDGLTVTFCANEAVFYDGTLKGKDLIQQGGNFNTEGKIRILGDVPTDCSLLQTAVEEAVTDLSPYTSESAAVYAAALDTARSVLADAVSQERVDSAFDALSAAFEGLALDKSALEAEIAREVTDLSPFSKKTANAYAAALQTAKDVLANDRATLQMVEEALAALIAAREALQERVLLLGDPDGDEEFTSTDARLTLQLAVGKIREADIPQPDALDVDGDSLITSTDARLILQKSV